MENGLDSQGLILFPNFTYSSFINWMEFDSVFLSYGSADILLTTLWI